MHSLKDYLCVIIYNLKKDGVLCFSTVSYLPCWNKFKVWTLVSFQFIVLPVEVNYFGIDAMEIFLLEIIQSLWKILHEVKNYIQLTEINWEKLCLF